MDYDRRRVAYPDSSSRNDVLFSCGECAIKRQLIAVSYLKMGLSYRELPHPRSCPLQGSIHLVNEEGGCIKVQSGHLCGKNSHSRASHHVSKGFVGPEMYLNFLYSILPLPLSFTGIVLIFNEHLITSISISVFASREPNHNFIVLREHTLYDFSHFECINGFCGPVYFLSWYIYHVHLKKYKFYSGRVNVL